MQKVIIVSIDVNELSEQAHGTFSVSELEGLNDWLEEGWEIEEWSFLTDDDINGKISMMVLLNDNLLLDDDVIYEALHEDDEEHVQHEELDGE